MGNRYSNEMTAVCHDMMKDMYKLGGVSEAEMREFEENCLEEEPSATRKRRPAKMPAEAV
jgi:DNA-binding transcriptional regulator YiaG